VQRFSEDISFQYLEYTPVRQHDLMQTSLAESSHGYELPSAVLHVLDAVKQPLFDAAVDQCGGRMVPDMKGACHIANGDLRVLSMPPHDQEDQILLVGHPGFLGVQFGSVEELAEGNAKVRLISVVAVSKRRAVSRALY
jgi:hypothetical protein